MLSRPPAPAIEPHVKRITAQANTPSPLGVLGSRRMFVDIRYTMREVEKYDAGNCEMVQQR
jgi:hypothetical protein